MRYALPACQSALLPLRLTCGWRLADAWLALAAAAAGVCVEKGVRDREAVRLGSGLQAAPPSTLPPPPPPPQVGAPAPDGEEDSDDGL
jgi:hypothetical protein